MVLPGDFSEWGGRNRPSSFGHSSGDGNSSVASFLVWGGGQAPKCTDIKKSYTCNLYARASEASERLRNITIGLYFLVWYGAINDSIVTLRKSKLNERARSERAWKIFPFSHSKTAISFNILLVLLIFNLRNTFSGLKVHLHVYIQSIQLVITYGMALYINDSIPTKH